jgi:hypothetical protein
MTNLRDYITQLFHHHLRSAVLSVRAKQRRLTGSSQGPDLHNREGYKLSAKGSAELREGN